MRGCVIKKGNSYYCYFRDPSTKKQKWIAAGKNKKLAEKKLIEIIRQVHRGEYWEIKEITFKDFVEKWLSDYAEPRVKRNTLRFYSDIIKLHLIPHFGQFTLTSINAHMVEEYLAKKRRETKLSPTSIGYHLRVLKTILKRAVIWGYLAKNPAEHIEKPRAKRREMDCLNSEELNRFLDHVTPNYYPLFLTVAYTGMRKGELLALKWGDVNWTTNQIHVRRSLCLGQIEEPKTRASVRAIIIPLILIKALKKHKFSSHYSNENDLIFPNSKGKVMDPNNLTRCQFEPALRRAGLRKIRFHDLRHTYASLLIAAGENLKFVQEQLGHSSITVTMDRYGHVIPQVQHEAEERLEKIFSNTEKSLGIDKPKQSTDRIHV